MLIYDPYPGLRSHRFDERDIFFGRDDYIQQLIDKLEETHFTVIVGDSGCGKSSLIRAGLIPALVDFGIWHVVSFRPLNAPFQNAADALLDNFDEDRECPTLKSEYLNYRSLNSVNEAQKRLRKELRATPESLCNLVSSLISNHVLSPDRKLLIIVDQFEEIFRRDAQKEEVGEFVAWLLKTAECPEVYVVISMRHEYIGACINRYPELYPFFTTKEPVLVPPLTAEQLKETIELPAKVRHGEVEPELVEKLLQVNIPDRLSLLQHALMQMWDQVAEEDTKLLTLELYDEFSGNLGDILENSAEQAYENLGEMRGVAEILFRRLTQKDDKGSYTRTAVTLEELIDLTGKAKATLQQVIDTFRSHRYRFLTPEIELKPTLESSDIIDITHESLIRQWKRLRKWADEEYDLFKDYEHLDESITYWKHGEGELSVGATLKTNEAWYERLDKLYQTERQKIAWVKRYSKDYSYNEFSDVVNFLEQSKEKDKDEKQKEADRKRQAKELQETRRKKLLAYSFTGIFFILSIIAGGATLWAVNSERQRTLELFNSQRVHAALFAKNSDYTSAQQLLSETHKLDNSTNNPNLRHARNLLEWFTQLMGGKPIHTYSGANVVLQSLAVSPNEQLIVAVGEEGTVVIFDNQTGQFIQTLKEHTSIVNAVAFDPHNQWFATGGNDKKIIFWSISKGKAEKLKEWSAPGEVWALAVTPDGKQLASGGDDNDITLWNIESSEQLGTFKGHTSSITDLSFDTEGKILASASYDDTARLWNVGEQTVIHVLQAHSDNVQSVVFSPDNKLLATGSNDETIRLWDVESGKSVGNPFKGHNNKVFDIAFLNYGKQLVSASQDGSLRLWDVDSRVTLRVLQGHSAYVTGVAVQGHQILSTSTDGSVKRWESSLPYQQSIPLDSEPSSVAIAPDAKTIAVGFANGDLHIYPLPLVTQQPSIVLSEVHTRDIQRIAFNSQGTLLATASLDGTAKVWQVTKDKLIPELAVEHSDSVNAVIFSPDDKTLVTASYDNDKTPDMKEGKITIVDLATQKTEEYDYVHGGNDVNAVAFDGSGEKLLTASDDEIRVWNFNEFKPGEQPKPLTTTKLTGLMWASLNPQGQLYSGAGWGNFNVNVYDINGQLQGEPFKGHDATIIKTLFSPDGQQLASASANGEIRFWDLQNKAELFTLRLPTQDRASLWDFDFHCTEQGQGDCWLAVPLTQGKLITYHIGKL